ncbi:DegT/DnrJ/EryC1/StrS family aminotransferase [Massilia sp. ST3]|uniref:DegT/DnrJ/EryC1/StrS family aminotransferase n=1 Tax=Massilia sp. ST3 TaxID=2824903 RepID=UPI001B83D7B0|nr:DegT/DnrJ/EryC1/StrS family aminotransferase [Massilia sp. ST3]MBQ5947397.1 DegT/DnrJ/EryC1/StrS aminotransferase family protein [Massilia sp. ST3]
MPSALLPMRPRVPIAPILSASSFRRGGARADDARLPSVLDAGSARFVTSGRVAIALALREMAAGPGDTVLVPAWHSPSMIPPVLWRGATPVFYRLGPDGAADLDDIAAKAAGAKVLMVTHYFGFHQDLPALRALCDRLGLGLLEDCAHAFIGEHAGRPLGAWGDYAIASSMKFFPIYEGGVLVSRRHDLRSVRLRSAGPAFEAKIALNSLERGFDYGRLPALRAALWLPMALKDALWRLRARPGGAPAPALAPSSSDSSFDFDPRWVDKRSSLFARAMLRLASPGRIAAQRRTNWLRLDAALRGLPGVRPMFDSLPDGVCPWVYPLLADDAPQLAARLSAAGVPVVGFGRPLWQGVDASVCPNAARLSASVLSLPCHQELSAQELDWMIATVSGALRA